MPRPLRPARSCSSPWSAGAERVGAEEPARTSRRRRSRAPRGRHGPAQHRDRSDHGQAQPGTTAPVDVTFKGDTVDPQARSSGRSKAGEPLTLHITADQPGEIHVHSSPEQEIEYAAGTTDKTLTIDQPGVVDVESHDLDQLIVQLEVR